MELTAKKVIYAVASIGAIAWAAIPLLGGLPFEQLAGLDAETAKLIYGGIGVAGVVSFLITASLWQEIDTTAYAVLYLLADVGAIFWLVYWYNGQLVHEISALSFLAEYKGAFYLLVAFAGLASLAVNLVMMDENSSADDPSDVMG